MTASDRMSAERVEDVIEEMATTSHEATITIDCEDITLKRNMFESAVRSIADHYGRAYVLGTMTIYHERDKPYTARLTWQAKRPAEEGTL